MSFVDGRYVERGKTLSRRVLFKLAAAASGAVAFGTVSARAAMDWLDPRRIQKAASTTRDDGVKVIHSVCLGCNTRCGNRAVVKDGRLELMSGNPYHSYNHLANPISYATPVQETLGLASPVCGKAQAAPQYLYNPYRILKPLKRSGPRGAGKFEPIEWDQLIAEIVDGGRPFAGLGEDREVKGLKALDTDDLIDPKAPELGSVRNTFVFMTGRLQSGRKEIIDRFVKSSFGSKNRVGHTDICGLGFRMGNWAFTGQKEVELKADPWGAEYILVFGANVYEGLQPGINVYAAALANRHSKGQVKFTIVDPRAQNASCHAEDWIPVKPGQDGAFAMAMIRWILENGRYNKEFLAAPNGEAAKKHGNACHSNATHLVITEKDHPAYGKFLRLSDLLQEKVDPKKDPYQVFPAAGKDPVDSSKVDTAVLDAEASVKTASGASIAVKTAFRLMKEGVMERTLQEYAELSGVPVEKIEKTAREFVSHGTKAAVCQYHGAGNYAGGTHAAYAVAILNALVGSVDRMGGYNKSGGGAAKWDKGLYDLKSFPGKKKPGGVMISREKAAYEKSSEYKKKKEETGSGYPAKRPWFPFSKGGLSTETLSGIDQQYPYGCNILVTYFFNPVYSIPGGYRFVETLKDPQKVPLHISVDTGINESNLYADYIVPDITYLEGHYGWLNPHAPTLKFTGVRTPCVEPLTGKTKDGRPFSLETFLVDLAERAKLPGFGAKAMPGKDGQEYPLHTAEDFYMRAIANIGFNAKVPAAPEPEVAFVERNYPVAKHRALLNDDQWKKACFVLARGGVFKKYDDLFDGEMHKYGIKKVYLYNEKLAQARNSLTGERFSGTLKYTPPVDSKGKVIEKADQGYPFFMVTYKMHVHTQSRTTSHRWAMEVVPENFVNMCAADAAELGLKTGDAVRLISPSNADGIVGKVQVTNLVRRGCLGVSFHYGHSQLGASELSIKNAESVMLGGKEVAKKDRLLADKSLGTGLNPNMVSRLDEGLANTPLVDVIGGIPDFSSTRVKVIRA